MAIVPVNFFTTTLRVPITAADTQISLGAGAGAALASITAGNYAYLTVTDGTSAEIMKYASTGPVSNDTIQVTRGQDNTFAKSWAVGACITIDWNVAQNTDYILQLIRTTPSAVSNTRIQPNPPITPPVTGVIYHIDTAFPTLERLYYWTGAEWILLSSSRNTVVSTAELGASAPTSAPPAGVIYAVDTTLSFPGGTPSNRIWWWNGAEWLLASVVRNTVFFGGGEGVFPGNPPPMGVIYAVNTTSGQLFYYTGTAWVPIRSQEYSEVMFREWNVLIADAITLIPGSDNNFGDLELSNPDFVPVVAQWQSNEGLSEIISIHSTSKNLIFTPPAPGGSCIVTLTAAAYGERDDSTKALRARLVLFSDVPGGFQYATDAYLPMDNLTNQVGMTVSTGPMRVPVGEEWAASVVISRSAPDDPTPNTYSGLKLTQFCLCASVIARHVPLAATTMSTHI